MSRSIEDLLGSLYLFNPSRPAITCVGEEMRWLDDGQIITFTNPRFTFDNVEFTINNRSVQKIWLSQLCRPLYSGDVTNLQISTIKLKNGQYKFPYKFNPNSFWALVKGRKFKVHLNPKRVYQPNKRHEVVKQLVTYEKIYNYVQEHILKGEYSLIKDVLIPDRAYDLEEI
ncbi:MAG: hypothetical protein HDS17_05740 [Bacteroides sp.]|nr:hypothetical protein [Bacteroides sp.]